MGDRVAEDDRVSYWNRTAAACGGQLILGAGFGSRRLVDHHCDLKPRGNLKRPSESHRWICGVRLRMKTSDGPSVSWRRSHSTPSQCAVFYLVMTRLPDFCGTACPPSDFRPSMKTLARATECLRYLVDPASSICSSQRLSHARLSTS